MPLTVFCFSKIHIGFTFLVQADPGSPGQRAVNRVCVINKPTTVELCISPVYRRLAVAKLSKSTM